MRWFKHYSDSLQDSFIGSLIDEFGYTGYFVFFGVLETYSRQYKKDESGWELEENLSVLARKLFFSRKVRLVKILDYIKKSGKWDVRYSGKNVIISISKFDDLLDNWTVRKPSKNSKKLCSSDKGTTEKLPNQKEKNRKEKKEYMAIEVLDYLNDKTGKHYRKTDAIMARLNDGGTVDDCKRIIDVKLKDDYFTKDNGKYLRPSTLFAKSHWDDYLNEAIALKRQSSDNPRERTNIMASDLGIQ